MSPHESESIEVIAEPGVQSPAESTGVVGQVAGLMAFQLLSPAAALLAEIALAWRFGASGIVDAYRVTVLLLLYGQQFFVTHILPCTLVPIFAEYRAQENEGEAWVVADSVARMLLLFGAAIAVVLFFWPGMVVSAVAPGLAGEVRDTAILLIRWCGVAFIPMCWTGAACGVLYAYNIFQIAPLAQFASNMMVVLAIVLGGGRLGASSLALGLVAGSAASTLIHMIRLSALRREFGPKTRGKTFDFKAIKKAVRIAAPLFGSVISGQSTSVVVNRVLSRLSVGTLASFGYALKMGTLVRLLPSVMATVLLPKFSATWYSKGRQEFTEDCGRAIRATIYVAVPITALCWAFRRPLVALLFQRGAFTNADVTAAATLFGLLILNGPAVTVTIALGRAFYAVQDSRTPLYTDVGGNLLELMLIPVLAHRFGAGGAAAAYTVIPWVTMCGLIVLFRHRFGTFPFGDVALFGLRSIAAAAACSWIGSAVGQYCNRALALPGLLAPALEIAVGASAALILFYGVTLLLGFPEARRLRGFALRSLGQLRFANR